MLIDGAWFDLHRQQQCASALKYLGIILSTGISISALRKDTVIKSGDPLKPHKFTVAGRYYLAGLLTLRSSPLRVRCGKHRSRSHRRTGEAGWLSGTAQPVRTKTRRSAAARAEPHRSQTAAGIRRVCILITVTERDRVPIASAERTEPSYTRDHHMRQTPRGSLGSSLTVCRQPVAWASSSQDRRPPHASDITSYR